MFRLIFWVLVLILVLSFFDISIRTIVNSPAGQENFSYVYQLLVAAWNWLVPHITTFFTAIGIL